MQTHAFLLIVCAPLSFTAQQLESLTTFQNQSSTKQAFKNSSDLLSEDVLEVDDSTELLNDYNIVKLDGDDDTAEFRENSEDVLRIKEEVMEEEEGSALSKMGDYYDDDYNEEAESAYAGEEGTELNDEVENSIQVTTSDPEAVTKVIEIDVVTIEGRSFEEEREASEETTTAKEDSLVNETLTEDNFEKETREKSKEGESLVETSGEETISEEILEETLEEESLVKCFYVTPSTTFSSLPDSISCSCSGAAATFKVFFIKQARDEKPNKYPEFL